MTGRVKLNALFEDKNLQGKQHYFFNPHFDDTRKKTTDDEGDICVNDDEYWGFKGIVDPLKALLNNNNTINLDQIHLPDIIEDTNFNALKDFNNENDDIYTDVVK